jgi:hypothetical protein
MRKAKGKRTAAFHSENCSVKILEDAPTIPLVGRSAPVGLMLFHELRCFDLKTMGN